MKSVLAALSLLLVAGVTMPSAAMAASHPSKSRPFPITVIDDHHNRIHIASRPQHIVTLFPGETEILFALGLEKRVVGDASFEGAENIHRSFRASEWPSPWGRDYPTRSLKLPHISGGCCGTPYNIEAIVGLHADLVIGPFSQADAQTYQKMRDLGIKVIILDPSTINGVLHDISLVGKATGTEKQAATVTGSMKKTLSAVEKHLRKISRPRVYYEIDATNPTQPYTAGRGTFIDQGIKLAGGKNVADSATCLGPATLCYPQFSLESLVKLNPQVIVLGDAQYGTTPAQVRARAGWSTISAVKSGKIYRFDDDLISRAGPRIMIGIDRLAHLFHPRLVR